MAVSVGWSVGKLRSGGRHVPTACLAGAPAQRGAARRTERSSAQGATTPICAGSLIERFKIVVPTTSSSTETGSTVGTENIRDDKGEG